jgi:hypothetical protein
MTPDLSAPAIYDLQQKPFAHEKLRNGSRHIYIDKLFINQFNILFVSA